MNVSISVQKNIVWLDVSVDDVLAVNIAQGATKLSHPESHRFFGERLSRDVESQIAAAHQIDYQVHVLDVLKTVTQVANERMVDVLEHSTFADDVAHALGANN